MQLEDGEDVQVGLGEGKGKDRHWGGSGGFWRWQEAVRASSWAWPELSLCAFHCLSSLSDFTLRVRPTCLVSSDNSSVQIIGYTGKCSL